MNKSRVLLITPRYSYRIAAYLQAAQSLGIEVTVVSDGAHSLVGALQKGMHVDLRDPLAARQRILDHSPLPHGVIATDDNVVELAADIAQALGLPGNPSAAGRYARRKDHARRRLQSCGVPVPAHQCMALSDIAAGVPPDIAFPLVVKPLAMSASRGVIRADDCAALRHAGQRIARIVAAARHPDERQRVLIEQYLPGTEIALEGILYRGRLHVVAVFDKPAPLTGPFFEESYYVTPSAQTPEILADAASVVQATCDAYGLRHGPIHAELRINDAGIWVLETAARTIGGQCAMLVEFATGHCLEELVMHNALDVPPPATLPHQAAGVLMIPIPTAGVLRRIEGVLEAQRVPGVETLELWVREGHELVPLPEGSSYLGFIFATGDDAAQVEAALRRAHACLKIVTAPKWDIEVQGVQGVRVLETFLSSTLTP
ncbi:MAG: ATP-grasp domain-containing protein [Gammaproteobacteria bacterium]|nr:ATP-grasp domain-containing protein [Gammaproteobacteria bacterium]